MRWGMWVSLMLATTIAGCGTSKQEEKAAADATAKAAGFTPPAVMSRVDFGTSMDRRFRRLDRNADDRITPDELPRRTARMMQLDKDQNGAVSAIEWSEGTLKWFDTMDLNRDGTVTSEEHEAWRKAHPRGLSGSDADANGDADPVGDALTNTIGNAN
ncbi:MAG: EF-hand domain-containing protein [Sphingomonas bacterium]|nr:EF-hand domain-containing protein [Sphingomonas bacterium]